MLVYQRVTITFYNQLNVKNWLQGSPQIWGICDEFASKGKIGMVKTWWSNEHRLPMTSSKLREMVWGSQMLRYPLVIFNSYVKLPEGTVVFRSLPEGILVLTDRMPLFIGDCEAIQGQTPVLNQGRTELALSLGIPPV